VTRKHRREREHRAYLEAVGDQKAQERRRHHG